jgi:hypothetical protein
MGGAQIFDGNGQSPFDNEAVPADRAEPPETDTPAPSALAQTKLADVRPERRRR